MTEPTFKNHEDPETDRDDRAKPEANADPEATTEDQAANMDYEGDTPN